jgi:hypothetical protein
MKRPLIIALSGIALIIVAWLYLRPVLMSEENDTSTSPAARAADTLSSFPILQPAVVAYIHGDKSTVVSNFLAVDWSIRPLFAPGSALNLSDSQFHALAESDYHTKSYELSGQFLTFMCLASTVAEAAQKAARNGDTNQARKCFISLKQFGTALDSTNHTHIVQLLGREYEKLSDAGMAKIAP